MAMVDGAELAWRSVRSVHGKVASLPEVHKSWELHMDYPLLAAPLVQAFGEFDTEVASRMGWPALRRGCGPEERVAEVELDVHSCPK